MTAEATPAWNIFKQIFAQHWDGFTHVYPRYNQRYYDGLVHKMLACGNPDQMGYIEYRCLQCGEGTHRVALGCKSSLCLRCARVYVDNWVSQVSRMLHEGVIYRHMVLTVPEILRKTFYQQSQALLSPFMHCGVRCLDDVFSRVSGRALQGGYIVGGADPRAQWSIQSPSAHHRQQRWMGSPEAAVDPSRLCAVSHAPQEVAVVSADHAAADGEDPGDQAAG